MAHIFRRAKRKASSFQVSPFILKVVSLSEGFIRFAFAGRRFALFSKPLHEALGFVPESNSECYFYFSLPAKQN